MKPFSRDIRKLDDKPRVVHFTKFIFLPDFHYFI